MELTFALGVKIFESMSVSFSIIIPALNEEDFICQCISSILRQNYKGKVDIIVVDNGSTDNTSKIAKKLGVRVIKEKQTGVSYARNTGVENSKYNFLFFVDADCIVPQGYLSTLDKIIREYRNYNVFAGPYEIFDGGVFARFITGKLNYFYWYYQVIKILCGVQCFAGGNFCIKKNVFRKIGGFDTNIDNVLKAEDLELSLRLYRNGYKVFYTNKLKILSSCRRVKKSPLCDTLVRFYYTVKLLLDYMYADK